MKRLDSILLKGFLYGLPAFVAFAIFAYFYRLNVIDHAFIYFRLLNSLAGLVIAVWMSLSLFLSIRLMVSEPFRDLVLVKLTFMRERDEREALLTGKATRTTFMTSLAILIFLLFLSCFQISIYQVAPERAVDGQTGMVSLGIVFNLLEHTINDNSKEIIEKKNIFSYTGLPISSTMVILVLIVWQIISYNISMRKLNKNFLQL